MNKLLLPCRVVPCSALPCPALPSPAQRSAAIRPLENQLSVLYAAPSSAKIATIERSDRKVYETEHSQIVQIMKMSVKEVFDPTTPQVG